MRMYWMTTQGDLTLYRTRKEAKESILGESEDPPKYAVAPVVVVDRQLYNDLVEELRGLAIQAQCRCGHPHCNNCRDTLRVRQLLGKV
jgi:hypothetical protein